MPGQRARAQEHGFVALPFFFCKSHHFKAKWQAAALAVQFTHTGHGHQNTQAPVVFAAIAHGIKVAAGEQAFGPRVGAMVDPHHIAHRVNFHIVKAAVGFHPVGQALCAGAVRIGEVGHSQLAALCVASVTVHGQFFCPVPHVVAQRG